MKHAITIVVLIASFCASCSAFAYFWNLMQEVPHILLVGPVALALLLTAAGAVLSILVLCVVIAGLLDIYQ